MVDAVRYNYPLTAYKLPVTGLPSLQALRLSRSQSMLDIVPQKCCTKCGVTKSILEFHKDTQKRDGISSWCKDCKNLTAKRLYDSDPAHKYSINRRWATNNRDRVRELQKRWHELNPDAQREADKRQRQIRPEKLRERKLLWEAHNPDKVREQAQRRRSRKASLPATFTISDWQRAIEYFGGACAYCGNPPSLFDVNRVLHQEHHTPVANGGGYTATNIIPACQLCNLSKCDKPASEWCNTRFGKKKTKRILDRIARYFEAVKNGEI